MSHLSDDDLILRYYGEADAADEAGIGAHLAVCEPCREAWHELTQTLKLVDTAEVPEPPDGFERVIWARVQQALPQPAPVWTWRHVVSVLSFAAAIALVASLGGVWGGTPDLTGVVRPDETTAETATSARLALHERVLLAALDSHFEQTELLLIELMNAPDQELAELGFERVAADELLASGRLYRVTAEQTGHVRLAQMLDDLEPVLVEVARSPEKVDRQEMTSLRSRIDDNGLLFKVRAVTNDIRERQYDIVTANEGGQ
jgi:hypothetical protein